MVLFKVGVSCYAAVLSDAKLKGFNDMSMSAKLSLMSVARVIASIAIATVMEPQVQPSLEWKAAGFFDHWTFATWIVTVSFTSKSLITLYLLKSLDGIQKNVGEAGLFLVVFSPNVELRRTSWTQSYWILGVIWGPQHPTRTFPNGFPNGFPKTSIKNQPGTCGDRHLCGADRSWLFGLRSLCIFVGLSGRAPGSNLWPGW